MLALACADVCIIAAKTSRRGVIDFAVQNYRKILIYARKWEIFFGNYRNLSEFIGINRQGAHPLNNKIEIAPQVLAFYNPHGLHPH